MTDVSPRALIQNWVDLFNQGDADGLAALYAKDAVNFQVCLAPIEGRENIRAMFAGEFAKAEMTCIVEQILADGDWGALEWRDPLGLRGCGFFQIKNGLIQYQRGYWDQLSFLRQQGLPLPTE
ncbi:nuclear transport factor 2 family protein [Acanthopleuribacter pedis]|uniref:Nuclear transport factor 2 family protein n=1 Tax=Acanthopleuribacter pedis TaxID=442870 RepID=A0A8J7U6W4_9BACT|nr:nuclear transport factor 2 family protein [Acanthopleuribacter pedis]MBO1321853.1 nuclear transport factor 2 family protein [Acanthopleuribacter pedis]